MVKMIQSEMDKFFGGLNFESKSHTYTWQDQKLLSVSGVIKEFVEYVDFDAKAEAIAKREGVPVEEVLGRWKNKTDISLVKGKSVHGFAETDMDFEKEHMYPEDRALLKFWEELHPRYQVVRKEAQMFHRKYLYSGTSDLTLYDEIADKYIIADYKTNEDLFKNFRGKRLLAPFQDLKDMPFNKYQIQLCFYQILFEQLNVEVSERWLIHLKPTGEYKLFKTYDFTDRLKLWLQNRKFSNVHL